MAMKSIILLLTLLTGKCLCQTVFENIGNIVQETISNKTLTNVNVSLSANTSISLTSTTSGASRTTSQNLFNSCDIMDEGTLQQLNCTINALIENINNKFFPVVSVRSVETWSSKLLSMTWDDAVAQITEAVAPKRKKRSIIENCFDMIAKINEMGEQEGVQDGIEFLDIHRKATIMDLYPDSDSEEDYDSCMSDIDYSDDDVF